MHLVLTDSLTCPRCGAGLIVMADRMDGRQIMDGQLGCPGCRTNYPVRAGTADLRVHAGTTPPAGYAGDPLRLLALTGVTEARGFLLLVGGVSGENTRLAGVVPNLQLVAVNAPGAAAPEVSVLLIDELLPFAAASMRGVILTGSADAQTLAECVRVCALGGRVVIDSDTLDRSAAEAAGLRVLASEGTVTVGAK